MQLIAAGEGGRNELPDGWEIGEGGGVSLHLHLACMSWCALLGCGGWGCVGGDVSVEGLH